MAKDKNRGKKDKKKKKKGKKKETKTITEQIIEECPTEHSSIIGSIELRNLQLNPRREEDRKVVAQHEGLRWLKK